MTLAVACGLAVLVGAVAQSVSGIGFSLVCGPLLVAALGPADGVRLGLVLSVALNITLLVRHRREVDVRGALTLLVPTALALPVFAWLLRDVPERPAAAIAGGTVVAFTLLLASGLRWQAARGVGGAAVVGVVSAGTTVAAAVSGPPVALYAANADWSPDVQRATLNAYFLGVNAVAVPSLGLPGTGGVVVAASVVGLAAGLLLGGPLARRASATAARRATLVLAGGGGLVVLVRALLG